MLKFSYIITWIQYACAQDVLELHGECRTKSISLNSDPFNSDSLSPSLSDPQKNLEQRSSMLGVSDSLLVSMCIYTKRSSLTVEHLCKPLSRPFYYDLETLVKGFNENLIICSHCGENLLAECWRCANSSATRAGLKGEPTAFDAFLFIFLGSLAPSKAIREAIYLTPKNLEIIDSQFCNMLPEDVSMLNRALGRIEDFSSKRDALEYYVSRTFFTDTRQQNAEKSLYELFQKLHLLDFLDQNRKSILRNIFLNIFRFIFTSTAFSNYYREMYVDALFRLKAEQSPPIQKRFGGAFTAALYTFIAMENRYDLLVPYSSYLNTVDSATFEYVTKLIDKAVKRKLMHIPQNHSTFSRFSDSFYSAHRMSEDFDPANFYKLLLLNARLRSKDGCADPDMSEFITLRKASGLTAEETFLVMKAYAKLNQLSLELFRQLFEEYFVVDGQNVSQRGRELAKFIKTRKNTEIRRCLKKYLNSSRSGSKSTAHETDGSMLGSLGNISGISIFTCDTASTMLARASDSESLSESSGDIEMELDMLSLTAASTIQGI